MLLLPLLLPLPLSSWRLKVEVGHVTLDELAVTSDNVCGV
jgi:hypothetical protein